MRISKVTIENFRNYRGIIDFELDKKITILYGDNGFGKSSFFDAIEWGLTGLISRFEKNDNDKDFDTLEIINESVLSDEESKCSVKVYFGDYLLHRYFERKNGKNSKVYVELKNISNDPAVVNTSINGRNNIEEALKEIFLPDIKDAYIDIKQPFILSQDQVTDFVLKDKPKNRYKALANLLGLNKVVNYSENMRLIIRELNKKSKEYQDDIMRAEAIINSKTKIKPIKLEDIVSEANFISIKLPPDIKKYNKILGDEKFKLNSTIINTEKKLNIIKKYSPNDETSLFEMYQTKEILVKEKIRLDDHIKFAEKSYENLSNKISRLEDSKLKEEELTENLRRLREVDKKIKELTDNTSKFQVGSINEVYSFDEEMEKTLKRINSLNYNISYYEDYNKIVSSKNDAPLKLMVISKKLKDLYKKKERKIRWTYFFSEWILDNSDVSNQIKLSELLEGVREYLKATEEETCPVCSTNKNGNLVWIAENNLRKVNELVKQQSTRENRIANINSSLKHELNSISEKIKELENVKESLVYLESTNSTRLKKIKEDTLFNLTDMKKKKILLLEDIEEQKKKYTNLNESKKNDVKLKELLAKQNVILKKVEEVKEAIKNSHDLTLLYFYTSLDRKRKKYLEILRKRISNVNEQLDLQKMAVKMLSEYEIVNDDVPLSKRYNSFNSLKEEMESKIIKIDTLIKKVSEYELYKSAEENLVETKYSLKKSIEELGHIELKIEGVKKLIADLNHTAGSESIEFLNKKNSTVQQLYRYLNPMVNSKMLKFVASNEELNIKVIDEEDKLKDSNAKYVLSSGQLNVLALSIFLAVNSGMNSKLDLVAIDDPIQNMDDVNQFTVCDVLSNIKRQLIFSTHDLNFVKLFIKKNEHLNGDIQVYMLKEPIISSPESYERLIFE